MASPWPAARCGRPRSQPCRPTAPSPLPWRCPYAGHPPVPQGRRLSRRRPRWPGLQSRARGPEASYAPTAATLGREPPCAEGSLARVPPPGPGADGRRCRTAVTASPGGAGGSPDGGRPARGSPRRSRRRPQRASTGRCGVHGPSYPDRGVRETVYASLRAGGRPRDASGFPATRPRPSTPTRGRRRGRIRLTRMARRSLRARRHDGQRPS
jgi:hypothetical protein